MDWRILIGITVVTWGGYNIALKMVAQHIDWRISMFLFVLSYAIIVGAYCLLQAHLTPQAVFQKAAWGSLIAGILCGLGAITYFKAIAVPNAPGSVLLPLVGLATLVSAIGCLIILKEPVSARVILGMLFAGIAIVLLSK